MSISGSSVNEIAKSSKENGWGRTLAAVSLLALGAYGFIYLKEREKRKNKIKVIKEKEDAKGRNDEKKDERKERLQDKKHQQAMELERLRTEDKKEVASFRAGLSTSSQTEMPVEEVSHPMRTLDEILAEKTVNRYDRMVGYPFIIKGGTIGICGPPNIGKTAFTNQVCRSISTGICTCPLADEWIPIRPTKVLLFSTEQSDDDMRLMYSELRESTPNLFIETEGMTLEEIKANVKEHIEDADDNGMVVCIDNYTKLSKTLGEKKTKELDRFLTTIQNRYQNTKPITLIKVYHTDDNYRNYLPFEDHHIKGSPDIIALNKNFIFLGACREGSDTRILKIRKDKVNGVKDTVSILKYAYTPVPQFVYVREDDEANVLPLKPAVATEGRKLSSEPQRRGPKPAISDEEILLIHSMHDKETTWAEIEEAFGIKEDNIKKRYKTIMKRRKQQAL